MTNFDLSIFKTNFKVCLSEWITLTVITQKLKEETMFLKNKEIQLQPSGIMVYTEENILFTEH
jgi:hypothetical protein